MYTQINVYTYACIRVRLNFYMHITYLYHGFTGSKGARKMHGAARLLQVNDLDSAEAR